MYVNNPPFKTEITISGSKSESNRWLILRKLYPFIKDIINLSNAEDTELLEKALNSNEELIDVHHAGTAMRFLTAYYALCTGGEVEITGSERMKQRPIYPLVEALQSVGVDIEYLEKEGYPPLKIKGTEIHLNRVEIQANVSSQYITALMLVAPVLESGLEITFTTPLTSRPYIEMTKQQLESLGIKVQWIENGIKIESCKKISVEEVVVESDWSSASYWYSWVALSEGVEVVLKTFKKDSLQGDAELVEIYKKCFGVDTIWEGDRIRLVKNKSFVPSDIQLDLIKTPDIAQTIAVTCAGLKIKATLTGLHTLKVKETDRLQALQNELLKIGVETKITEDSLSIIAYNEINEVPYFDTYNDHRMAMSFTPLAWKREIYINNPQVVVKSYPNFWKDMEKAGLNLDEIKTE